MADRTATGVAPFSGAGTGAGPGIPTDRAYDPYKDKFRSGWVDHPGNRLDHKTCLEYFSTAKKFYSTTSLYHQATYGGQAHAAETRGGIWYDVDRVCDGPSPRFPMVVLTEKYRQPGKGRDLDVLRGAYYMLEGDIYKCPPLHTVLRARILKAAYHIEKAFSFLQEKRTFDLVEGFGWETEDGTPDAASDLGKRTRKDSGKQMATAKASNQSGSGESLGLATKRHRSLS